MVQIDTGLFVKNTAVPADRTTATGARRALASLLVADAAGSPHPGVLPAAAPGGLAVLSASTSVLTFSVGAGYAVVTRAGAATLGGYLLGSSTALSLTLAAATGSPRIDIVYVAMPDPEQGDATTVKPRVDVAQGTPASSPVAPTGLLPVGSLELARILVPAGATAASACTITDTRKYTGVLNAPFYAATTADLPASGPYGQTAVVGTGSTIYRCLGTSWALDSGDGSNLLSYPGTVTNLTPATNASSLVRSGLIVSLNLHINLGANGASGAGTPVAVIPAGWRPAANTDTIMRTSQDQLVQIAIEAGGNVALRGSAPSIPANVDLYGSVTWTNRFV